MALASDWGSLVGLIQLLFCAGVVSNSQWNSIVVFEANTSSAGQSVSHLLGTESFVNINEAQIL
jgi:hypothetical protein